LPETTRVYYAQDSLIDSLSPLKNSQGLIFSCKYPQSITCDYYSGIHVLLDNIQDPGNVGTIIRSANAFGIDSVILTGGCADIYNPKTIRASMGAIFRQRVTYMNTEDIINLKTKGVNFTGAENRASSKDITKINISNTVILLGNEGQGISNELLTLCDEMIKIPISEDSESLNAAIAASVIMWEVSLKRHPKA
jgi:TrmH family RNA methyltransferase